MISKNNSKLKDHFFELNSNQRVDLLFRLYNLLKILEYVERVILGIKFKIQQFNIVVDNQIKIGLQIGDEDIPIRNQYRVEEISNQIQYTQCICKIKETFFQIDQIKIEIKQESFQKNLIFVTFDSGPFLFESDRMLTIQFGEISLAKSIRLQRRMDQQQGLLKREIISCCWEYLFR
ncbi:unnamed protein product [Paramecium primaurelia]|uniref:Uncharacterized protein n=1 Tax=Paramecium primaurelia TaxID=5886 RepID=A0A8S1LRL9_PARPR|nr:unnamed protein product [Paramecium primaurelia]